MKIRFAAALFALLDPALVCARSSRRALDAVVNALTFRNIGPFRTAAWVTEVAVPETPLHDHLYTIYAATPQRRPLEDDQRGHDVDQRDRQRRRRSRGRGRDRAVEPQHRVDRERAIRPTRGRRYSGKGVFKSTDAGATWQFMGLPDSHHIARIVIHPTNPDIVYVAAMGHLFSKNAERGVFRTMDGGKTWKKVLYVNDGVGAIDLVINRKTPGDALRGDVRQGPQAVADRRERPGERHLSDATTAARNGQKLAGGLPTGKIGRIGLDIYQKNPLILYALLENQNPKPGAASARRQRHQPARRRHHRQRAVSDRRRRQDVAQGDGRQRRRRQGAVLVQPDAHRSARRQDA